MPTGVLCAYAQDKNPNTQEEHTGNRMDSVHISLLTCSPHNEVYSLYGHTAIRFEDKTTGMDVAINYGMFSFEKPFFVLRFVFGLTDYEMGIIPFGLFCDEYRYYGSSITQQEFNLTAEEKSTITHAISENDKPENRVYRYNYFYNNCTTKARDIIIDNIKNKVIYETSVPEGVTFRKLIHSMNAGHPWAKLGNDLLLGIGADLQITQDEMQFLPSCMMNAADSAFIVNSKGESIPLIIEKRCILEENQEATDNNSFVITPTVCAIALLILTTLLTIIEWKSGRRLYIFDFTFMLLQGICGIILTAMIFTQHPTVRTNLQILIFNPLPILFGWQALRRLCHNVSHWLWKVEMQLCALFLVLIPFEIQWIDPSITIVALCLLIRYSAVYINSSKHK